MHPHHHEAPSTHIMSEMREFEIAANALVQKFIEDEIHIHELPIHNAKQNEHECEFFKKPLSQTGEGLSETVKIFSDHIVPTLVCNSHPRFFNWVVGGRTAASVLGDFYTTVFDQLVMLCGHGTASHVEHQTIQWLLELFDLSAETFRGVFTTGATEANLCALAAARQWYGEKHGVDISVNGLYGAQPPTVISGVPHSSIDKSMQVLGLGRQHLIKIGTVESKLDLTKLEDLLQQNANAIVIANCGEVNTGQSEDLKIVSALCKKYQAWLHVDAAFGLFARCDPRTQWLAEGIELADSITCDAHKLGNVPYGCGFLFVNKEKYQYLSKSFATVAPYLSNSFDHPMNTHVANSQRFLALPLWFSLLAYGKSGYQDMVKRQYNFAYAMGQWLNEHEDYELLSPVVFNIVLFRHKHVHTQDDNQKLISCINSTNQLSLSGTVFNGTPALRLAVANWHISLEQDTNPVRQGLSEGSSLYLKHKESI